MYSTEISQLLADQNYMIKRTDYFNICSSSPQITHVHYDAYSDKFRIYTDDGYEWEFEVRKD